MDKPDNSNIYNNLPLIKKDDDRIPIYRGCQNQTCFCTGKCKEVIGYEKIKDEKVALRVLFQRTL